MKIFTCLKLPWVLANLNGQTERINLDWFGSLSSRSYWFICNAPFKENALSYNTYFPPSTSPCAACSRKFWTLSLPFGARWIYSNALTYRKNKLSSLSTPWSIYNAKVTGTSKRIQWKLQFWYIWFHLPYILSHNAQSL